MPLLLDLYCGQGGAAVGYARAGWDVVGVDWQPQARYPFQFHRGDALEFLAEHGDRFDAVHASPPCHGYSIATAGLSDRDERYERSIPEVRAALRELGKPYVIENVEGAPLLEPILLCGTMFGLGAVDDDGTTLELRRHRLFESNVPLSHPGPCRHGSVGEAVGGVYGGGASRRSSGLRGGYTPAKHVRAELMDVRWMSQRGLSQAIPPAYTEHVGGQLLAACRAQAP